VRDYITREENLCHTVLSRTANGTTYSRVSSLLTLHTRIGHPSHNTQKRCTLHQAQLIIELHIGCFFELRQIFGH